MNGTELRKLRIHAGMTQAQFAEALGLTRETVNKLECGRAPITQRTKKNIESVAQVHISEKLRLLLAVAAA